MLFVYPWMTSELHQGKNLHHRKSSYLISVYLMEIQKAKVELTKIIFPFFSSSVAPERL